MDAVPTLLVTPVFWYVSRDRGSLCLGIFGFRNNGNVVFDVLVPDPGVVTLFAFVVAIRPYAFLDSVLPELKYVTAWAAGFTDLVHPEFPGCVNVIFEVIAGAFVFVTVSDEPLGLHCTRLSGLAERSVDHHALERRNEYTIVTISVHLRLNEDSSPFRSRLKIICDVVWVSLTTYLKLLRGGGQAVTSARKRERVGNNIAASVELCMCCSSKT